MCSNVWLRNKNPTTLSLNRIFSIQLLLLVWCPATRHHWEDPCSIFFKHFHQIFIHSVKIPLNFYLPAEESWVSWLLSVSNTLKLSCLWPFTGFTAGCPFLGLSTLYLGATIWTQHSSVCHQRGGIISLYLLVRLILMEPRKLLAFFDKMVYCWIMIHFLFTKILGCFSVSSLPFK